MSCQERCSDRRVAAERNDRDDSSHRHGTKQPSREARCSSLGTPESGNSGWSRPGHGTSMMKMLLWKVLAVSAFWAGGVEGTKHHFRTHNDGRLFIGPIGESFGILKGGVAEFRITGFHLTALGVSDSDEAAEKKQKSRWGRLRKKKPKSPQITTLTSAEVLDKVEAGFLLKKFDSEADFAKFHGEVSKHHYGDPKTVCSIRREKAEAEEFGDDFLIEDDDFAFSGASGFFDYGLYIPLYKEHTWDEDLRMNHTFTDSKDEGLYFLMFQICLKKREHENLPLVVSIRSSFDLSWSYHNVDAFGNPSYLTAGEMPLPHIFLYFTLSYATLSAIWILNVRNAQLGKQAFGATGNGKVVVHRIHHMMSFLLLLKMASLLFESCRYHFIRTQGHAEGWTTLYYGFAFVKGIFLFLTIALLGTGWSVLKPFLNLKEKRLVVGVLILQICNNVAIVALEHLAEGEQSYDDWNFVCHIVDIVCCILVLVPIVWQVNAIQSTLTQEEDGGEGDVHDDHGQDSTSGLSNGSDHGYKPKRPHPSRSSSSSTGSTAHSRETARTLSKLRVFRSFYLLVMGYLYFTRVGVYLVASAMDFRHLWVSSFLSELATVAFYVIVGFQFRPQSATSVYLPFKTEDDVEVEMKPLRSADWSNSNGSIAARW